MYLLGVLKSWFVIGILKKKVHLISNYFVKLLIYLIIFN